MNESMQDGLRDALSRLRADAASQSAPAQLEGKLMEAFRAHHAAKKPGPAKRVWMSVAIAASLALAFLVGLPDSAQQGPAKAQSREAPIATVPAPPAKAQESAPPVLQLASEPRKAPKSRRLRAPQTRPSIAVNRQPAASEEPFIQIPYAPPFTAYDEGQVMRVNMAGSSARRMGMQVMANRVQADLLVGNDGLPRAVRLVSYGNADPTTRFE